MQSYQLTDHETDPKSTISGLTATGHLKEILSSPPSPSSSLVGLLYSYWMVGIGIQLNRSEASNVDPWKISVTYISASFSFLFSFFDYEKISPDWWDTTSAMCGLHAMATHKDSLGKEVQDVLVLVNPKNPKPYEVRKQGKPKINVSLIYPYKAFLANPLHDAYMGVIYARNPDIQLPTHRTALLMVTTTIRKSNVDSFSPLGLAFPRNNATTRTTVPKQAICSFAVSTYLHH